MASAAAPGVEDDALDSPTRDSLALSPALLDVASALAARCRALEPARAGSMSVHRVAPAMTAPPRRAAAPRCWPLDRELTAAVLVCLPSAARLAARAVCREWRAVLAVSETYTNTSRTATRT